MKNVVEFAKDVLGISLYPAQAEALLAMADHQVAVLACGRRGGKSSLASIWATYDSTMRDLRKYQRKGEVRHVILVAASAPQARSLFRTVTDLFQAPLLHRWFWESRPMTRFGWLITSSLRSFLVAKEAPAGWRR